MDRWECYVFVKEGVYNVIVIDLLVEIYLGVSYVFILLIESWLLNFINCLCISICFDVVNDSVDNINFYWLIDRLCKKFDRMLCEIVFDVFDNCMYIFSGFN